MTQAVYGLRQKFKAPDGFPIAPSATVKINVCQNKYNLKYIHTQVHYSLVWFCCSSSSSESKPGKCLYRCSPSFSSMSVSSLKAHHTSTPKTNTLKGKTFHQGRWYWLPMERSTFQDLWLALLVENFKGSLIVSSLFVDLAELPVVKVMGRTLSSLWIEQYTS